MLLVILMLGMEASFAEVVVGTYGISPREAGEDTLDIFDRPYNGLLNVGIGTKMYLAGATDADVLVGPTWTVRSSPSAASIGATIDMDAKTQVAVFIPEVPGTYVLEFADGGETATITINAGTYLGIENGGCKLCHRSTHDEWEKTGHHNLMEVQLTTPGYFKESCIVCHATGYDAQADNDGFDDFTWVFPDSQAAGTWDALVTAYPRAMRRARVQCESCHGPGSEHMGFVDNNKIVSTLDAANCAWCHDDGHFHVYPEQWDESGHANPPFYSFLSGGWPYRLPWMPQWRTIPSVR
jgi:hypothetical protein